MKSTHASLLYKRYQNLLKTYFSSSWIISVLFIQLSSCELLRRRISDVLLKNLINLRPQKKLSLIRFSFTNWLNTRLASRFVSGWLARYIGIFDQTDFLENITSCVWRLKGEKDDDDELNEKPQKFYLRNFSWELRIAMMSFCLFQVVILKKWLKHGVSFARNFFAFRVRTPSIVAFSGKVCPSVKSNLMVRVWTTRGNKKGTKLRFN